MRFPSKKTSPSFGSTKPPIIRSVVVFPQPEGPRKVTNSLSWISRFNPSKTRCPSNSTTMSLRLMIVLLILHPPLRILSLTSKIPGSASLCRLRFPPDCGAGNQPAGKPPPQYKTLSTPSSFLYRSPQKACSNRNGNPARFRRYRNWMLRLCAALERCARIRRIFMRAKGYWIFAGNPACTDAKVLPVKRQYTATTTIT